VAGYDRCEEVIRTVVDLVSWTASTAKQLTRLHPVAGDMQSVRQQQDAVQVHDARFALWFTMLTNSDKMIRI